MFDITLYTNKIMSPEIQTILDPYEDAFILFSFVFIILALILIILQKNIIKDAIRRSRDFLTNPKTFAKPRKFLMKWKEVDKLFEKNKYSEFVLNAEDLLFLILKRYGYQGKDLVDLILKEEITDNAFSNIESIKRIGEIGESLKINSELYLREEEMRELHEKIKESLIKMGIIE